MLNISFDVDDCDPTEVPGSGTSNSDGVSFCESLQMLENCAGTGEMVSMEVVELNPFLDEKNISAERTSMLVQSAFRRSIR